MGTVEVSKTFCPSCDLVRATLKKLRKEYWRNDTDRRKPKYMEKNLSQCHFVYRTFHMDWLGIETKPPWREAGRFMARPIKGEISLNYI
jgi:hypothetical protein